MNLIEIERHKKIIDYTSDLIKFCNESDKVFLSKILNNSKKEIEKANKKDVMVYHYSKIEKGRISASIQKICEAAFYDYNERSTAINKNPFFIDICKEILEDEFIFNKYLALKRHKVDCYHKDTPLEKSIRNSIRIEICNKFVEINKRLTNKTLNFKL